jgi:hypothetical protein
VKRSAATSSLIALLAVLSAALLPASAAALIKPHRGIGGIRLNMTRAQVVAKFGEPDGERFVRNEIIGRQRAVRYGRTRAFFGGFRRGARVVTINTRDPRQRTRSGVGIGSTPSQVLAGVRGVRCRGPARIHTCVRGVFRPGERVTIFDVAPGGRVNLVVIGFVID